MAAAVPANLGYELIRRGWGQGSLFQAAGAQTTYISGVAGAGELVTRADRPGDREPSPILSTHPYSLAMGEFLVIASQPCDIVKHQSKEPFVEALRAFWTSEKSVLHNAANRSAIRYFLLDKRSNGHGGQEGLLADAAYRLQFEKAALLLLEPRQVFAKDDILTGRFFQDWLAKRYQRAAIPDHLVESVHKPIIEAFRKLRPDDGLLTICEGIREILYEVRNDRIPYELELLLISDQRAGVRRVEYEELATLAGWLETEIGKKGVAKVVFWDSSDYSRISVEQFAHLNQIPLDGYTLPDEDG